MRHPDLHRKGIRVFTIISYCSFDQHNTQSINLTCASHNVHKFNLRLFVSIALCGFKCNHITFIYIEICHNTTTGKEDNIISCHIIS